jgi:hypothetical protein
MRGTSTGASAVRLPTSRTAAHQRHRHAGRHATTTDAPTRAQMSTRTPTLTPRRSSGGHHKTLQVQPCCCAAARR